MKPLIRTALGSLVLSVVVPAVAWAQAASASPHGALPQSLDCTDCHTATAWKPIRVPLQFDHNGQTRFPLTGQHQRVPCLVCHLDARFDEPRLAPEACASCHVDVHQGNQGSRCGDCHSTNAFKDVRGLAAHAQTAFPLTGAHLQITCEACHRDARGGAFTTLNSECFACHQTNYASAKTVDHVAAGFPKDCTTCHSTLTWAGGVAFDHQTASRGRFALLGAHRDLRCASCHTPPTGTLHFQPSGQNDCFACHQADYAREHGGAGFPTTCVSCHTVDTWDAAFDHLTATSGRFGLVGAHTPLACTSCHLSGTNELRFPAPSNQNDCVACHQADYNRQHSGSGFSTTCLDCHTVNNWDANFDHLTATSGRFGLVGAHTPLACTSCHVPGGTGLVFPTPSNQNDCLACHQADYTREHNGSGFPTDCLACHTTSTFIGADFRDHDAQYFPIYSGAHNNRWNKTCSTCHTSASNYAVFTCLVCHEHDQTRMDDKHRGRSGYVYDSQECYRCHANGRAG